jgi:arylsulfatase A-like enzyme
MIWVKKHLKTVGAALCRDRSLHVKSLHKAAPTIRWISFLALFILLPSSFCLMAQPNIVFIMADDLGYGDLGCYGNTINKTPNIDALAASGLRFTDFHSSGPMCSPTRAGTLTGLYQQRFGAKFDGAISGVNDHDSGLPLAAVTIAEVLKKNGYATGCFGKWHLGFKPAYFPTKQGFDEFRGLGSGDGDFFTHVDRSGRPDWWLDNANDPEEGYTTDLITRHSINFIERHRDEPFFLYVPHLAIHFPWQGPQDPPHRQAGTEYYDDKWGVIPDRSNVHPHVKAMIESLDSSVGNIMAALKKEGLIENTLVIFTSDNGGYINYSGGFENISSNGVLRGQKTQLYEGGHRVPTMVSWPGKIKPGLTDETTHSTDWFPTFATLAGITTTGLQLDGTDLAPLLFDGKPLPNRNLYWRIRANWAVRSGPWKLVYANGNTELFNLDEDIGELKNLASAMPERVEELKDAWSIWEQDVNQSAEKYQ